MNRRPRAARTALALTATAGALAVLAPLGVAVAAPAPSATPVAPDARLTGAWVNTGSSPAYHQVLLKAGRDGLHVDLFGACSPSDCELGDVTATVYGASVSSGTGQTFLVNERSVSGEADYARRIVVGTAKFPRSGAPSLTLTEYTEFLDGSGRRNYSRVEHFTPGGDAAQGAVGSAGTGYPAGQEPRRDARLIGSWKNTDATTRSMPSLEITDDGDGTVSVHGYGACNPSACDWGSVAGVLHAPTVSSDDGKAVLASYDFGFAETLLSIRLGGSSSSPKLTVQELTHFKDGSGRSDYAVTEHFVRS